MARRYLEFRTTEFETEVASPDAINDAMGEDLILFLLDALVAAGHESRGHGPEDWGWYGDAVIDGEPWTIGVGLVEANDGFDGIVDAYGNELPEDQEDDELPLWRAWVHPIDPRRFWDRLFRRVPPPTFTEAGPEALLAAVETIIDVDEIEWVDENGRPSLF
ncbi:MAG: hypothetical protein JJ863_02300 [Deltaproteobacteria bacterium]|nr:hypothetical protein [Deltaproteobacteria bacterium]